MIHGRTTPNVNEEIEAVHKGTKLRNRLNHTVKQAKTHCETG